MNPDDYDSDGNNIVPCPICLDVYCPSKEGGKCSEEAEFIKHHKKTMIDEATLDEEIVKMMETYGGSFVQALAQLWHRADANNRLKIKVTWQNYWGEYETMYMNKVATNVPKTCTHGNDSDCKEC